MERVPYVNWIKVASAATREREKSGMFVHSLVRFLEYSNPLSQSLYWSRRERMGGGGRDVVNAS